MKRGLSSVIVIAILSLVFSVLSPISASAKTSVDRLDGASRFETAVEISKSGFDPGVPVLYVATGSNYPDALSAASAAAHQGGPLLLVEQKAIPPVVRKEIQRLKPAKIVVVGGTGAVSGSVYNGLKTLASSITRLSGTDRYATSRAIASYAFSAPDVVYLATGRDFPDALSAAAAAASKSAPVLLVDGTAKTMDATTTNFIKSLGVSKAIVVGGTGVVKPSIESQARSLPGITSVTRLAGDNRFSTSVAVNKASFPSADSVFLATGSSFPDALAGAALAGSRSAPLYVVPPTCLPGTTVASISALMPKKAFLLGGTGALASSLNSLVACSPDAGYPRELSVTVVPAGEHQVKVSWTGQGRATKVAVIAGSEGGITKHKFVSAWYPPSTKSITLTVPEHLRAELGTGSGNPIFVKVATYNSLVASDSAPSTPSVPNAYRLSPAGSYAYAGPTSVSKTLRVAEWNVNSVAATKDFPGYGWSDRRAKVVAGIERSAADIVATVELTTADAGTGSSKDQWEDLRDLLAPKGYEIAFDAVGPAGVDATKGAHLFYRPSAVDVVDSGLESAASITPGWNPSMDLPDRYFAWAKFTQKSNGKQFIAASVHLPAGNGYAAVRNAAAIAIDEFLEAHAAGLPIVLMGDLNSSFAETPDGPQTLLIKEGYYDASSAPKRHNPRYSTANITNQIDNKAIRGYPSTPYAYKYPAPRIDYILLKRAPGANEYSNQVILKNGKFDPAFQGSDHNLQWADIAIR